MTEWGLSVWWGHWDQSGLKATIDFIPRTFFGPLENKVVGSIVAADGSALCELEGQWDK